MDEAKRPEDLVPLEKAAERLGISRATMWRRVKELGLAVYANPFNRRVRLLSWAEIEQAAQPKKSAA
jgi:predicted DNA-binding transcriptional regulator AlpA